MRAGQMEISEERQDLENIFIRAQVLLCEDSRDITAEAVLSCAVPLVGCLWQVYARCGVRQRAGELASAILCYDAVWEVVKEDASRYVSMLRDYDASPFSPNAITVLKDGPYRRETVMFLRGLLERRPDMAEHDIRDALEGLQAKRRVTQLIAPETNRTN